jgi:hypothetical protein
VANWTKKQIKDFNSTLQCWKELSITGGEKTQTSVFNNINHLKSDCAFCHYMAIHWDDQELWITNCECPLYRRSTNKGRRVYGPCVGYEDFCKAPIGSRERREAAKKLYKAIKEWMQQEGILTTTTALDSGVARIQ